MAFLARLLVAAGFLAALSPALANPLPESEVRAAIIVNLVHYVEWPDKPGPAAETLICVAGRGATADALLAYNGKVILGRSIAVVARPQATANGDCRIFFIGETGTRSAIDWLRDLYGQPVLTVSEGEDFLSNGGIVSINRNSNRIVFDVNLAAVRRSNLRIGSQALRLARDIHGK